MGKIICEICGTVYPDSADCCPICGYSPRKGGFDASQDASAAQDELYGDGTPLNEDMDFDDLQMDLSEFDDMPLYEQPADPAPQQSAPGEAKKQIFDYDAVNRQEQKRYDAYEDVDSELTLNDYPEDSYDNYDTPSEKPRKSHVGLIIFLVLLILALIGASALLLVKVILPGMGSEEPEETYFFDTVPVSTTAEPTTEPTTVPTVPCESLVLVEGGTVELNRKGQFYLIHAVTSPEGTTDPLTFLSENQNVATVDERGKITAEGEGETNIVLTCGTQSLKLPVTVVYKEETQPSELPEMPSLGGDPEKQATATEAPTEDKRDEGLKDVELKLKKTDLMSGVRGVSFQIELDCDLEPTEVEWLSTNGAVATVVDGTVTTVGPGVCKIVAKYGSQEASCVIRCTFQ